jgi:hypothetical protein
MGARTPIIVEIGAAKRISAMLCASAWLSMAIVSG